MPTIPKAERSVRVGAVGVPQQKFAPSSVFKTGDPELIKNVSDTVFTAQLKELTAQNETKARELDNEFRNTISNSLYSQENGYYNKRGQDAFVAKPVLEQTHQELYKQFVERAENPEQAAMFSKVAQARMASVKGTVDSYAHKEYQAWQDSAKSASIVNDVNEAVLRFDDPKFVGLMRQSGENKIQELGISQGKEGPQIADEVNKFHSDINVGIVERMIPLDVTAARAKYEEFSAAKGFYEHKQETALLRKLKIAEKGDLATDRIHYSEINKIAANDPAKFVNLDLSTYELSDKDYKKFDNDQRVAQKNINTHNEKYSDIRRALTLSGNLLKKAKIQPTGKSSVRAKQLADFESKLIIKIEEFKSVNKRAPEDAELLKMTTGMLSDAYVPGGGLFGYFNKDDVKLFEDKAARIHIDDIDDDIKAKISDSYRRTLKRDPSDREIEDTYTRSLRSVKSGAK